MAAPKNTVWGSTIGSYGKIGIYLTTSDTNTVRTVNVQVWLSTKYSATDSSNNFYFDFGTQSPTTNRGSVSIKHTVDSGSGWSTSNQTLLGSYSMPYSRIQRTQTGYCSAKLSGIDVVGGTMTVSTSFTVPELPSYPITYNANGGTWAPSSQTKWYGTDLILTDDIPTRTNYNFLGWATSSSGSVVYSPGAKYSGNAALPLYAVWELAYIKPRIKKFSVSRWEREFDDVGNCINEGMSDEGTYAFVQLKWECDREVSNITVSWSSVAGDSGSETIDAYGTSGETDYCVIGNGSLNTERTYTITVTVTDALGSSTDKRTLNGAIFAIDALPYNKGVAFGKAAEREGYMESKFKAHFLSGLTYDIPIYQSDVDTMLTSGKYYIGVSSTNKPGTGLNGWLEVQSYGDGNYCYQQYITYTGIKYERWRQEGVWGAWSSSATVTQSDGFWISGVSGTATFYRKGNVTTLTMYALVTSSVQKTTGGVNLAIPAAFAPLSGQVTGDRSTATLWGRGGYKTTIVGAMSIHSTSSVRIYYDFASLGENWTLGASMTWIN